MLAKEVVKNNLFCDRNKNCNGKKKIFYIILIMKRIYDLC